MEETDPVEEECVGNKTFEWHDHFIPGKEPATGSFMGCPILKGLKSLLND